MTNILQKATLGMGCFWCSEAIFQQLKGIKKVTSGYSGGELPHPSYDEVSAGNTGHAEVIQIEFDSQEISYEEILYVFWHIHNPTTLNKQGADVGTQYRSVIFYHNDEQKISAEKTKQEVQKEYEDLIVTEISPYTSFYEAEDYHKNYYKNNKEYPYCQIVIDPKIQKLKLIAKNQLAS